MALWVLKFQMFQIDSIDYGHIANLLITSHLQNNKLSGTLDVLQNLPLRDL